MKFETVHIGKPISDQIAGSSFAGLDLSVTSDLIDGYLIQHISGSDGENLTLTNFFRAHGSLTYGNVRPTVVLSSAQILRDVVFKITPSQRPQGWDGPFKRGFKIAGSPWWPSLIPEVESGWIVLLNEDHPLEPRLNGCFKVGEVPA